jgi:hypothetical protein
VSESSSTMVEHSASVVITAREACPVFIMLSRDASDSITTITQSRRAVRPTVVCFIHCYFRISHFGRQLWKVNPDPNGERELSQHRPFSISMEDQHINDETASALQQDRHLNNFHCPPSRSVD